MPENTALTVDNHWKLVGPTKKKGAAKKKVAKKPVRKAAKKTAKKPARKRAKK